LPDQKGAGEREGKNGTRPTFRKIISENKKGGRKSRLNRIGGPLRIGGTRGTSGSSSQIKRETSLRGWMTTTSPKARESTPARRLLRKLSQKWKVEKRHSCRCQVSKKKNKIAQKKGQGGGADPFGEGDGKNELTVRPLETSGGVPERIAPARNFQKKNMQIKKMNTASFRERRTKGRERKSYPGTNGRAKDRPGAGGRDQSYVEIEVRQESACRAGWQASPLVET